MEVDVARKNSVVFLNNVRQLTAFRECGFLPCFGLRSARLKSVFPSESVDSNGHPRLFVFHLSSFPKTLFEIKGSFMHLL